ncbi:MAG TPA: sugar transferase [Verrucomicrobiae bacterium]|jgi:lipopolysaccharide/colanic/teichoic acid biosynthesis glycosyltransferase
MKVFINHPVNSIGNPASSARIPSWGSAVRFSGGLPASGNQMANKNGIPLWKRILDISFIVLISPVLVPLGLTVVAIIRAVSRGPIFFKQERVGYHGKKFLCFKFRTMHVGVDSVSHEGHLRQLIQTDAPMVKLDTRDPRIIPLGVLLRSAGLDELPQLINVLRGEMSMVGPRPCLPYEYEQYLPWQRKRFNAAPGLTGLWQVSGKNRTTFTEMISMDIDYGKRRSLWLDLQIIFKTIPALLVQISDTHKRKNAPSKDAAPEPILRAPVVPQ